MRAPRLRPSRRHLAALLAAPFLAAAAPPGGLRVTDMLGRDVLLPRQPRRIILLDARDIVAMALLHPDPASLVAGWAGPELLDSDLLRRSYGAPPGGGSIPVVGGVSPESRSPEAILALAPDLVVATAQAEPDLAGSQLLRQLAAAGIPAVFSSADANRPDATGAAEDPAGSLVRLMALWGTLLGREAEAEAFTAFVRQRLGTVSARLASVAPCPTYLEVQSTYDECCWAAGGRIWGALLALAGGRVPAAAGGRWFAKLSPEQLIAEAPEAYIATGGAYAPGLRPAIGPGLDPQAARAGLRRLAARPGLALLPAIRDGRVHGIWSGLVAIRPLNLLFVEAAARWLHPALFHDLDPGETLRLINTRFLARPLPGPLWVSLS
ncbi:ABC transporter substrate-binding protein [Pseudoroseomonas cervicalis]|uniref:ABC transporter substrate-binding protein n=1 Tax=Teichococcus cervicalis TaxID=204525 RepID=UPI0022F1DBE3|nr:ABC transporter substrate-binding protein [Pseudoroseomonas cervicalis]WBV41574.1 ABC transporter substrate-binding protein [Pseudoroseomonas cervicalis]